MISQVVVKDYSNETIEEQLKWIDDVNAKASTSKDKAVPQPAIIEAKAGPSTRSSYGVVSTTSDVTRFGKSVGKGKKNAGKSIEKDIKGPKLKKRGGKKKNYK